MNPFLKACGADGPLQLIVDPSREGTAERRSFDQPFVLVGRDPLSDLVLEHRDVSERHAYFQSLGGRLFCVDLGSRIGTHFGGKCRRSGWLGQRQGVRIGPYRIRSAAVPVEHEAGGATTVALAADRTRPRLVVELSHRGLRNTLCPIEEQIALIGSATDCALRILDPSVSNYHCSLLSTPQGIWVVDLLGQGGVSLNGAEVRYARVYDGDELRVGSSALRLRYEFLSGPTHARVIEAASALISLPAPPPEPEPERAPEPRLDPAPRAVASPPVRVAAPSTPVHAPVSFDLDLKPLLAGYPNGTAELVASIVEPLIGQFGLMQQQMLDQFQQAGMSMFQAFSDQHHEQIHAVREELDRLRELTEEFDWLRAQMTFHLPAPTDPARGKEPARTTHGHAPARTMEGGGAQASGRLGSARVGVSLPGALALLAAEADEPAPQHAQGPPDPAIIPFERPDLAPAPLPSHELHAETDPADGAPFDAPTHPVNLWDESAPEEPPGGPTFIDEPVHDYLYRRMALIQREREGRWKKLIRMMPGALPKKSNV